VSTGEPAIEVEDCTDDRLILPLLERDRRWSAYALCDLDPPYRRNTRLIAGTVEGAAVALVLLYALGAVTALLPFGHTNGVRAILRAAKNLPTDIFFISDDEHVGLLAETYVLDSIETMSRMTVEAPALQPAPPSPLPLERLTTDDAGAVADLYARWGPTFFDRMMIQGGIYYGARNAGRLVAVAGTHVISRDRGVAAIGGVLTHPDYRGRGLATAATGAVARHLVGEGIDLIVLNVRAGNVPAVAAYSRLGFRAWLAFTEGRGSRR
jgi:RimJ/RimL family protein N-acetyltransferase